MSESKRKFFSGRSVEQAVVAAASHYGIHPDEVKYREVEKRHGFVRTRRNAVIAVDPEDFRKTVAEQPAELEDAPKPARAAEESARPGRGPREEAEDAGTEEGRREEVRRERRPRRRGRAGAREEQERRSRGGRGGRREERAQEEESRRPGRRSAPGPWWQAEPVTQESEEMEDLAGPEEAAEPAEEPEEEEERTRYRFVERSEGLKRRERPGAPVTEGPRRGRGRGRRRDEATRGERRGDGGGRGGRPGQEAAAPARAVAPPMPRPAPRAERLPRVEEELAETAQDALDRLLEFAVVEAEADFFENEGRLEVELWGPDDHLLLEDDGQLLLALEHLLPRMLRSLYGDSMPVRVDCDDFHARREERLQSLALETAEEVRRRGKPRTLDELDPAERRIVHLTLADAEDVRTESFGDGYFKRVKIFPE